MSAKQKGKPRPQPAAKPAPAARAAAPKRAAAFELTQTFEAGFWRKNWLPALVLVALAFALYGKSIQFGYVLDDEMTIWNNAYVKKGWSGLGDIFGYDSFMGYFQDRQKLFLLEGGRYRPLSLATFAIESALWGEPGPALAHKSHFINILLYGLTGVLLFRILLGLFPLREKGRWWLSAAFFGAALFVLHPLHTEAVANIKGRDEILALFFSLAALYYNLKYFDTGKTWHLVASALSLLLGMLSKENALTFVAVIPLTAWFFARVPAGRAFTAALPLIGATLLFILIRYKALGFMLDHGKAMNDLMNDPFLGMNPGEKLATTFLTLGWYLKLLVWPHPLTHDYYPYQVPKVSWSDWRPLLSLALYTGMGILALLNLRKRRVPAYAIAFFLITLSIVSNLFVSVGTFMNERFVYTPSVAFCLLGGWFFARYLPKLLKSESDGPSILGTGLFVLAAATFAWLTLTRVPDWQSKLTLNTSAVKNSPNSARAHCFYAVALYDEVFLKDNEKPADQKMSIEERLSLIDSMDMHIMRAVQINPKYGSAWQMLPGVSFARFDAQRDLQRQKGGKGPQMDRLFNDFDQALTNVPKNPEVKRFVVACVVNLANTGGNPNKIVQFCYHQGYERFFKERNEPQAALSFLEAALQTNFEDERLFNALAEVYTATGNPAKAAAMQQRAAVARTIDPSK